MERLCRFELLECLSTQGESIKVVGKFLGRMFHEGKVLVVKDPSFVGEEISGLTPLTSQSSGCLDKVRESFSRLIEKMINRFFAFGGGNSSKRRSL